jgi:phosphopentomutase
MLDGPHRVGRVIARPFTGTPGNFARTRNRRDFSVPPPSPTILDHLKDAGTHVVGIGKIGDIFAHTGLTQEIHTGPNEKGILATLIQINEAPDGLIFTNLVDTDMMYGHRNDTAGYRASLEEFDSHLPRLMDGLHPADLLIITADHGCDPTTPSTDHSREYVPLLVYSKAMRCGVDLGVRGSFADTAATIAQFFGFEWTGPGASYLEQVIPGFGNATPITHC